jgi:hypothetical protein
MFWEMSKAERMGHAYLHFDHHLWQATETQATAGPPEKFEIREGQSLEVLACYLTASWTKWEPRVSNFHFSR